MSYLPVFVLGLLALVNLFVFAFLLWLTCKLCRVRRFGEQADAPPRIGIHFRRALAVVLGLLICGILITLVFWFLVPEPSQFDMRFSVLGLVLHLGLLLALVRLFVCSSAGRTILVVLLYEILGTLYAVGFVLVVSSALLSAYVIPTGSMAETLLGYHKDVTCPTCGQEFAINCSGEGDPPDGRPMPTFACVCPNCRQQLHFASAPQSYRAAYPESVLAAAPGLQRGDRFLAGRGLLGADRIVPQRFDVVAFEYPFRRSFKFIKRLIGLPGETIAIKGGELYVLGADKGIQYDAVEADREVKVEYEAKALAHPDDPEAIRRFEQGQFEILRKSPEQILVLRRLVYDNDHPAQGQPPRWKGEDGWNADGHQFHGKSSSAKSAAWMRYRHFLPDSNDKPALITDFSGYNAYQNAYHPFLRGENWVGDLLLECEATIENPQDELTLELSRGVDRFQARWALSTGICTLFRVTKDGEEKLDSKPTALNKKGSYRLRFANVDRRLVVWVDGDLPFENGVAYEPPQDLGPREKNDLEPASIGVRGATVAVHKLKLFRDTYYTVGGVEEGTSPHEADVRIDPTDPETWSDLKHPPLVTMYVQPEHYFVLGDNSPESSDSRSWGSISHRLLLGRVFFVYYPWKRVGPLH